MRNSGADGTKVCIRCRLTLPSTVFYVRPGRKPGALMSMCKPCMREYGQPYRKKYADRTRRPARPHRQHGPEFRRVVHCASMAVYRALKEGRLARPGNCDGCGVACKPDAHHHHGYARAAWLDVAWLCRRCHYVADRATSPEQRTPEVSLWIA